MVWGRPHFLRNLVGLENPSAGSIRIEVKDIISLEAFERACNGIGYVPQGGNFPLLTVENLLVALGLAGTLLKKQFHHRFMILSLSFMR